MRMDELKRGLWGYKKDSVYHYIVSMEEKASARMAEKDARLEQLEGDTKRQVAELEATIKTLREENAALRQDQATVFSTMLEAQKYAEQLRAASSRQKQQAQEQLAAAIQQKNQQLDSYQEQIRQLRAIIREMLREFDNKLEDTERALISLSAQAPGAALDADRKEPDKNESEAWKRISFI